jgi:hypothetical protein
MPHPLGVYPGPFVADELNPVDPAQPPRLDIPDAASQLRRAYSFSMTELHAGGLRDTGSRDQGRKPSSPPHDPSGPLAPG